MLMWLHDSLVWLSYLFHKFFVEKYLPPEKQDEVHPSKEEGNGSSFLFKSQLTVTTWENVKQGRDVARPLQVVGQLKQIFHFLQ